MKRITFTMDERGLIHRVCADEEVEAFIVDPNVSRDRVYHWGSLRVGREQVDAEIGEWPVGDRDSIPSLN
jgi:hypothetical protein